MRAVGQALDEAVQESLGLGVDPVQILEDEEERLRLRLAQEQSLDGIQRPLSALGWIEGLTTRRPRWARRGGSGAPEGPAPAPRSRVRILPVTFSRMSR